PNVQDEQNVTPMAANAGNGPAANPDETLTVSPATDLVPESQLTNALAQSAAVPGRSQSATSPAPVSTPRPPATPESKQLVQNLTTMFLPGNQLSREQSGAFREQLQQLIQHGAPGIPAIL